MKKRVVIIHGWGGYPEEGWFPWLKDELEKKGFDVIVPAMSNTDKPDVKVWVNQLAKLVGESDENTYLVGHSMGVQTILRYLATLKDKKIGGAVLVAGFFTLFELDDKEDEEIVRPWLKTSIDCEAVKKTTSKITAVFSDNDKWVPLDENIGLFEKKLSSKIVVQHNMGHFSGSDGVKKLPIVLETLLGYIK
jgi:predicted alpha/beta hydrolase family esterase